VNDYKDFWVVIGTAAPIIILAQIVTLASILQARALHPGSVYRIQRRAYGWAGAGCMASFTVLAVALGALSNPFYDREGWRVAAFATLCVAVLALLWASLLGAAAARAAEVLGQTRPKASAKRPKTRRT
jgi:MFS family permease